MVRIAVLLPVSSFASPGELLADAAALDAAGAYAELGDGSDPASLVVLGAVAAVTHRARVGWLRSDAVPAGVLAALDRISGGRAIVVERQGSEAWTRLEVPQSRAAWKQALAEHEAAGVAGLVVPWDPRLIDLLRNPDADDDRSDLVMSTG